MAKGRALGRIEAVFGFIGVLALAITYSLITGWNPLPGWANWVVDHTSRTLSDPPTTWVQRLGDQVDGATVYDRVIVVTGEGTVAVHNQATGVRMWSREAAWAAPAGDSTPVVVVGRAVGHGFDVYDAASGERRWYDDDRDGVWPYANMVLVLHCAEQYSCTLAARNPLGGGTIWALPIDGAGRSIRGLRPPYATMTSISDAYSGGLTAMSRPAPAIIGLTMADDVHVIATSGESIRTYHLTEGVRVAVTDHEVLISSSLLRNGVCYPTLEAHDPETDDVLWRLPGYNARTAGGVGCDQRHDPTGGGTAVLAVDPADHEVLVNIRSGKVVLRAPLGSHIIATDGRVAVVRTGDKHTMSVVNLTGGKKLWSHVAGRDATVGLGSGYVIMVNAGSGHLTAFDPLTGAVVIDAKSDADVIGFGPREFVLSIGRSFGPLPLPVAVAGP